MALEARRPLRGVLPIRPGGLARGDVAPHGISEGRRVETCALCRRRLHPLLTPALLDRVFAACDEPARLSGHFPGHRQADRGGAAETHFALLSDAFDGRSEAENPSPPCSVDCKIQSTSIGVQPVRRRLHPARRQPVNCPRSHRLIFSVPSQKRTRRQEGPNRPISRPIRSVRVYGIAWQYMRRRRSECALLSWLWGTDGKGRWRRRWDSNPRYPLGYTPLAGERLRPLGHVSADGYSRASTGYTRRNSSQVCSCVQGSQTLKSALKGTGRHRSGARFGQLPSAPSRPRQPGTRRIFGAPVARPETVAGAISGSAASVRSPSGKETSS